MFFIDKYVPIDISKAHFHKDILEKLKTMSEDESIPHIIFYGPNGSGKKTLVRKFLEMIYDSNVNNTVDSIYEVTGSGNSKKKINIKQSNYHIVIEPNNTNFDRYLIQDVVKEYAKRIPLGVFSKKRVFKTVLINGVDNLSFYAQSSLRRTMEIYSSTCRFIMWTRSLSRVIDPLKSRCYCFQVKAPSEKELLHLLLEISYREKIVVKLSDYVEIIYKSDGNVKKALWLLQLLHVNQTSIKSEDDEEIEDEQIIKVKKEDPLTTSYDQIISELVRYLIKCDPDTVMTVRNLMYKIMITNITGSSIIHDSVNRLMDRTDISDKCKIEIAEIAAKYEHNLIRGRREIANLDPFIIGTMKAIYLSK